MWIYIGSELDDVPPNVVGFVYIITNLKTGRQYVGKKNFYSTKKVKVKGKTRRKSVTSESDWKQYFGSNSVLLADLQASSRGDFKREILHLCRTKGEMALLEAKEQINREVLYHPDKFYNNFIGCKIHSKHLKLNKA
jgi:hypothetical protein